MASVEEFCMAVQDKWPGALQHCSLWCQGDKLAVPAPCLAAAACAPHAGFAGRSASDWTSGATGAVSAG